MLPYLDKCRQCCYEFWGHVPFQISVSGFGGGLNKYSRVELLDLMVLLFSVLQEISILFSIVPAQIYISTNSVGGFPFLHILANIYCGKYIKQITFLVIFKYSI